jgi:predicted ATPase
MAYGFVGLASLPDPNLVPSTVSTVLGISQSDTNPISGLTAWLRDKHALIVLDSCEHVTAAAAELAEAVLKTAPSVHRLAISGKPLRPKANGCTAWPPLRFRQSLATSLPMTRCVIRPSSSSSDRAMATADMVGGARAILRAVSTGSLGLGFDGRYWRHAPLAGDEIGHDNGRDLTMGRKRWLQTD